MSSGHSCVFVRRDAQHVTVKDSLSDNMVSIIVGRRRYSFNLEGEKILFTGCYTSTCRHSFVTGSRVAGPNVFHDCHAVAANSDVTFSHARTLLECKSSARASIKEIHVACRRLSFV